ncbi:GmrSD restriction endonuclease domain-containing protein [Cryptosporangium aurantiacum]|uniref:GmrSD restriction endonucleases N-terminal domain-containing protein n=1 Tax=Cryptosporangium aurantiacum TaxID=134849 RepID=A0A1M7RDD4_9ACTN|nr:DUF262 domain-containing protein [Cryptosporangium aurantiacum]SHN44162.1 Protein of unknown function DUF262 [Cryptosporangium aurantiacum]
MTTLGRPRTGYLTTVDLVTEVRAGKVRIPPFQRPYKWQPTDVVTLFDSLRRGFPIGSLLFWRRPAAEGELSLGPIQMRVPAVPDANWVVDGQQRIISIVGALTAPDDVADPRLRIVLDVSNEEFRSVIEPFEANPVWLPVSRLLDTKRLLAWLRLNSEWITDEQIDMIEEVSATVREYQIPTYTVSGDDERDLRLIFDRMNNSGRPMTLSEVFHALNAAGTAPDTLNTLTARVADLGFGKLEEDAALRCVRAYRGSDVFRDPHGEFDNPTEFSEALDHTLSAVTRAVEFLRAGAGIPHIRILPHTHTLYVLTRFCGLHGHPEGRAAELLRRWIWREAVSGLGHQSVSVTTIRRAVATIDQDPLASAERLLQTVPHKRPSRPIPLSSISIGLTVGKLILLGFLAQEPRDLRTGAILEPTQLLDAGPKNPWRQVVTQSSSPLSKSAANRIVHGALGGTNVAAALTKVDQGIADSHLLDEAAVELLHQGRTDEFFEHRQLLVEAAINNHIDRMAEWGARDGRTIRDLMRSGTLK